MGLALPVAGLVACALVLAVAATWWTAREQNRYAARTTARLAAGALQAARDALDRMVVDYAKWDEAAQRVAIERDVQWANENLVGTWLAGGYGPEMGFVLDGEGRAFLGVIEGERTGRQPAELLSSGFGVIFRAARAGTDPAGGLALAGKVPAVVVAQRIQPLTDKVRLPPGADAFLVMVDLLDSRRLGELEALYLLPNLRFAPGRLAAFAVPLAGADGAVLGSLAYTPERPGDDLLRRVAPPLAVLGLGLSIVTVLVLRQAGRAARALRASEARAQRDALTGLPNRALLRSRVAHELARLGPGGQGLALLYLDLDGFKPINDKFGHAAGDELLTQVACRLTGCARAAGDIVARLGGDEFVILLPDTASVEAAVACAERVMTVLHEPLKLEAAPGSVTVGVSVGVAHTVAGAALDTDQLLRAADRALYRAKREGRGVWRLAEELSAEPPGPTAPRVAALATV